MTRRPIAAEDLLRLRYVGNAHISPDGAAVVFTVKVVDTEKNRYLSHLWMGDVETGRVRQFTYGEVSDSAPSWSSDGSRIAFLRTKDKRSQIWVIPRDGGEARQLTKLDEGSIGAPAWSPSGERLAFAFRPTHPDWTDSAFEKRKESGKSSPPRVVTRLYYRLDGEGFLDLRQHIWTCDASTGEARQMTDGDYDDDGPAWSPDGRWLAFLANRSDDPEQRSYEVDVWRIPAAGGDIERLPTPTGYKGNLSWSPDGTHIAYTGYATEDDPWKPRNDRLWVLHVEKGEAQCLTDSLDRTAANMTIGDTREALSGGQLPYWSADGRRLFFLVSDRGSCHLYAASLDGGQPRALTEGPLDVVSFSADRDGKAFALVVSSSAQPPEVFVGRGTGSRNKPNPVPPLELRPLSRMNAPWLEEVQVSQPEEAWIKSFDGTEIQGWLLKPPDFDPETSYPLLLYVHGGPHAQYGNTFFHELQVHAARGYVVLYTNPRGSFGYGEEFAASIRGKWGSLDYQDVMAAADFAASLPYVDSGRMAIAGGSYGGYMTNWAISHTDRFRCAITDRSVVNLHSDFGTVDYPDHVDGYFPGNAWDRPETLWELSPLRYAANIKTPLLVIHSEGDLRCPISHAEQLYVALKHLKREVVFVRYPPETSHGLSRTGPPDLRLDRLHRIADWLDVHLKKEN